MSGAWVASLLDGRPNFSLPSIRTNIWRMAKLKIFSGCCPGVLQTRLKAADAEHLAAAFKVLADPARVRLLSLIAAQADGEACVCNLIAPLGLGQPTVSHHLKLMHEAGLL